MYLKLILERIHNYFVKYELVTSTDSDVYPISYTSQLSYEISNKKSYFNDSCSASSRLPENRINYTDPSPDFEKNNYVFNISFISEDYFKNTLKKCLAYAIEKLISILDLKLNIIIDNLSLSNNTSIISLTITDITSPFYIYLNLRMPYEMRSNNHCFKILLVNIENKNHSYQPTNKTWFTDQCINLTDDTIYQQQINRLKNNFDEFIKRILSYKYAYPNTIHEPLENRKPFRLSNKDPYAKDGLCLIRLPYIDKWHVRKFEINNTKKAYYDRNKMADIYQDDLEFKQFIDSLL